jgi:2'-5' RNA ligase
MFRKAKFFFGFAPPEVVAKYYDTKTAQLEQVFRIPALSKRLPAHITVISPFLIRTQYEFDAVIKIVREYTVAQKAPLVTIGDIGIFDVDPKNQTVYLRVRGTGELTTFAEGLAAALSGFYEAPINPYSTYIPHLSIARHLTDKQREQVRAYLEKTGTPFFEDIELSVLTLFRLEESRYEWHEEIPLRGN